MNLPKQLINRVCNIQIARDLWHHHLFLQVIKLLQNQMENSTEGMVLARGFIDFFGLTLKIVEKMPFLTDRDGE